MEKEKNERYVYCYEPYDGDSFIWDIKKDSKIEDLSECANVMNTLNEEAESWKDGTMVVKLGKLEEQLAEKEKEVQKWKNKKVKYIVDNIICDRNQTAIDELEQLKHDIWTNQHDDGWLYEKVDIYELTEMIDQKIKKLKGDK